MTNIIFEGTFVELYFGDDEVGSIGVTLEQDYFYEDSDLLGIEKCADTEDALKLAILQFGEDTLLIVDADVLGAVVH